MIIYNKLDNYFVVSADRQAFLGFEMTANLRHTSPLIELNIENELCQVIKSIRDGNTFSIVKNNIYRSLEFSIPVVKV